MNYKINNFKLYFFKYVDKLFGNLFYIFGYALSPKEVILFQQSISKI